MKKGMKSFIAATALGAMALNFTSCSGGGGSSWGAYQSPYVSVTQFVDGLNNADGAPSYDESIVMLYTDETIRSAVPGEENWFVIYDAKYDEYKAVSLEYIRSIVYYDYYASATNLAEEFRDIETDDILAGYTNGDLFGDDYEVVDYNIFTGEYIGRESGFAYEDEEFVTDVALMAAEKQEREFFKKAAAVSYTYNVGIETSLSLVTLGNKLSGMVKNGNGELTPEDEAAVMADLEKLSGTSVSELIEASVDPAKKAELVKDIASKIKTTPENLENKILPELFGL